MCPAARYDDLLDRRAADHARLALPSIDAMQSLKIAPISIRIDII